MEHFFVLTFFALAFIIPFYLFRVAKGPHLFDRLIGLNGIATKAILMLIVVGTLNGQIDMFLDIALGYSLLNLVGAIAIGKYLERKEVQV